MADPLGWAVPPLVRLQLRRVADVGAGGGSAIDLSVSWGAGTIRDWPTAGVLWCADAWPDAALFSTGRQLSVRRSRAVCHAGVCDAVPAGGDGVHGRAHRRVAGGGSGDEPCGGHGAADLLAGCPGDGAVYGVDAAGPAGRVADGVAGVRWWGPWWYVVCCTGLPGIRMPSRNT